MKHTACFFYLTAVPRGDGLSLYGLVDDDLLGLLVEYMDLAQV